MITNLYKEVLKAHQEGKNYEEISIILTDAGVLMFGDIGRLFVGDMRMKALLYIIHAYSEDSPKLLIGEEAKQKKHDILEAIGDDGTIKEMAMSFSNEDFNNVIVRYLNHQASSEFKHLKMTEDLYDRLYDESYKCMGKRDEDNKDFDQKQVIDNWKQLMTMRDQKNALRDEIKEKYAYVYDNVKEIETVVKKRRLNASIEVSKEIKDK